MSFYSPLPLGEGNETWPKGLVAVGEGSGALDRARPLTNFA